MKNYFQIVWLFLLFIVLTILTQVGGVILLFALLIAHSTKFNIRFKRILFFISLYILSTYIIIPSIAPVFGREKIKHTQNISPVNYLTIALNRNYISPDMNVFLNNVSSEVYLRNPDIQIRYLDACFPFIDGFPMLPHLSHNDGKKLDLSFVYENEIGEIVNKSKSFSGYGIFEEPRINEFNQTLECQKLGYSLYGITQYFTFGRKNKNLDFSEKGTKLLIQSILKQKRVEKIFIEPHLKQRMNLKDNKIRFQGCKAVRHDDHIHLQIK